MDKYKIIAEVKSEEVLKRKLNGLNYVCNELCKVILNITWILIGYGVLSIIL